MPCSKCKKEFKERDVMTMSEWIASVGGGWWTGDCPFDSSLCSYHAGIKYLFKEAKETMNGGLEKGHDKSEISKFVLTIPKHGNLRSNFILELV